MDVADWLRRLGVERYEATFRENDVDAALLPTLTAEDLKEIGISSFGHRRRLLEAIAELHSKAFRPAILVRPHPAPWRTAVRLRPLPNAVGSA
jgi:hypothetical protein